MSKTFRIIKIIDASTFIIDGGSKDGVKNNDKFKIMDEHGDPVKDLTGNIVGFYSDTKGYIYARDVQPKMSICKTGLKKVNSPIMSSFANLTNYERQIELNVDPADIDSSLDSDSPIKVGDNVELVSDTTSQNE